MKFEEIGFPRFNYQEVVLPDEPLEVCHGGKGNVYLWNSMALQKMPETWGACFYTEDWRFGRYLREAKLAQYYFGKFKYIFQPDFSVYYDQPLIDQWWRTWMGKKIASTWQKSGYKVIPSLVLGSRENYEAAVFGWQQGQVFAVQVQANDRTEQDKVDKETIERALDGVKSPFCLVYGTEDRVKRLGLEGNEKLRVITSRIKMIRAYG